MKRRNARSVAVLSLAATAGLVLSACGAGGQSNDAEEGSGDVETIKIAAPMPLTGPIASYGESFMAGAQITVDEINAAGGIKSMDGAQLELVVGDDEGDPARGAELLRSMVNDGAVASIGPIPSASVLVSLVVADELQVPLVTPSFDTQLSEQGSEFFFRVVLPAASWSEQGVEFLEEQMDAGAIDLDKVGMLTYTVPPGTSVKEGFESGFADIGVDLESIEFAAGQTKDFAPMIAQLRESDVDLVVGTMAPGDAALFADALELQDWRPKEGFMWVSGGATVNAGIEAIGPMLKNSLVVNHVSPTPANAAAETIAEKYASDTDGGTLDSLSGSAPTVIGAIAAALEEAGSADGVAIRDALRDLDYESGENWNTMAGGVKFDDVGNNSAWKAVITQHDGTGKQSTVFPADVASADPVWPAHD